MIVLNSTVSKWVLGYYLGPDHPGKIRMLRTVLRLSGARLKVPYAGTEWITLDLTDGVQATILQQGAYEPEVWESLRKYVGQDDVLWDVGANIGSVALRAAACPGVREVHCFEPHPRNFAVLSTNIALNPKRAIKAHRLALGDGGDELTIFDGDEGNCGSATLVPGGARQSVGRVSSSTIDRLVASGIAAPTLMKIDVERWELNVLRGGEALFRERPPRALVVEVASHPDGSLADSAIGEFLSSRGYHARHIPRSYGKVEAVENYLFFRE